MSLFLLLLPLCFVCYLSNSFLFRICLVADKIVLKNTEEWSVFEFCSFFIQHFVLELLDLFELAACLLTMLSLRFFPVRGSCRGDFSDSGICFLLCSLMEKISPGELSVFFRFLSSTN